MLGSEKRVRLVPGVAGRAAKRPMIGDNYCAYLSPNRSKKGGKVGMRGFHMNPRDFVRMATVAGILIPILANCRQTTGHLPHPESTQQKHIEGVNKRGEMAMGFDHSKTTHHFRLFKDGGAIGVDDNDIHDTHSRNAIRQHLRMIAGMFANGRFDLPMFIHATTPPGMGTMKRLKRAFSYRYETRPQGAQVLLSTQNQQVLAAIPKILRFQIRDHRTGDPMTVQN